MEYSLAGNDILKTNSDEKSITTVEEKLLTCFFLELNKFLNILRNVLRDGNVLSVLRDVSVLRGRS